MALNIAVPLATVGDLMDGFGLLSPISPLSVDCRGVVAAAAAVVGSHGKKQLVSPVGSESSGVSSLDSDEIKKPTSPPTTPTEEVDQGTRTAASPLPAHSTTAVSEAATLVPDSSSTRSSLSSSSDSGSSGASSDESSGNSSDESTESEVLPAPPKPAQVVLGGRNVLDLYDNLTAPNHFRLQFAQLPENDNIHFFLDNRSQYHRLGANGHIQEYTMVKCRRCDFRYPVNGTSLTSSGPTATMGQNCLASAFQPQQQPATQSTQAKLQWNGFSNNFNSIANSRDKMGLNAAAANAFNKTFGANNNIGSSNINNSNGSQYFNSSGNMSAAGLFGRDSNRNGPSNQKSYQQQQNFAGGLTGNNNNGNKFNVPYGNFPQQPAYSRNGRHVRYNNNNNSNSHSNGSASFNAVAAAAALINQQNLMQSFAGFNGKSSNNSNNTNNMFAYYKTMM